MFAADFYLFFLDFIVVRTQKRPLYCLDKDKEFFLFEAILSREGHHANACCANVNRRLKDVRTLLQWACINGFTTVVDDLIKRERCGLELCVCESR